MNDERDPVPEDFLAIGQATQRQRDYVTRLLRERGLLTPEIAARIPTLSRDAASKWINRALQIKVIMWADIPDGHYAVTGQDGTTDFYRVSTGDADGQWAGRRFVNLQLSDNYERIPATVRESVINKIRLAGPREAAIRYGKEIGKCAICHRTLTNPDSIERGIGPICADRYGWA